VAGSCFVGILYHAGTQDLVVILCAHANLDTVVTGRSKAPASSVFHWKLLFDIVREQNPVEKKIPWSI